jgi:outer membrane protein OmpA-like peptidoglycan-associated protein
LPGNDEYRESNTVITVKYAAEEEPTSEEATSEEAPSEDISEETSEAGSEAGSEETSEAGSEAGSETESEPASEEEPVSEPESEPVTESGSESGSEAGSEAGSEPTSEETSEVSEDAILFEANKVTVSASTVATVEDMIKAVSENEGYTVKVRISGDEIDITKDSSVTVSFAETVSDDDVKAAATKESTDFEFTASLNSVPEAYAGLDIPASVNGILTIIGGESGPVDLRDYVDERSYTVGNTKVDLGFKYVTFDGTKYAIQDILEKITLTGGLTNSDVTYKAKVQNTKAASKEYIEKATVTAVSDNTTLSSNDFKDRVLKKYPTLKITFKATNKAKKAEVKALNKQFKAMAKGSKGTKSQLSFDLYPRDISELSLTAKGKNYTFQNKAGKKTKLKNGKDFQSVSGGIKGIGNYYGTKKL